MDEQRFCGECGFHSKASISDIEKNIGFCRINRFISTDECKACPFFRTEEEVEISELRDEALVTLKKISNFLYKHPDYSLKTEWNAGELINLELWNKKQKSDYFLLEDHPGGGA